jgi:2-C-methyl-D-erythritol 4-phosphate cytidylyltransferase
MTSCIIVAAGTGRRFGSSIPKVFLNLGEMTVLEYSVASFHRSASIDEIVLVVPRTFLRHPLLAQLKSVYPKLKAVTSGALFREQSVYRGLQRCSPASRIVLVHDGARPFVRRSLIERVIRATVRHGSCVPVWPVFGAVKKISCNFVKEHCTGDFFVAQTPQGFKTEILRRAMADMKNRLDEFQDEASLLASLGNRIYTVKGQSDNLKITVREDMRIAECMVPQAKGML